MTLYTVHIEPSDGGFLVTVPILPGCITYGGTYEEAVVMARDAIEGYIETLRRLEQPIPREQEPTAPIVIGIQVEAA